MTRGVLAGVCLVIAWGCGDTDGPSGGLRPDALQIDAAVPMPDAPPCVPRTCQSPFAYCGQIDDGCGGTLACGGCEAPLECGVQQPNVCGIADANRVCNASGWCWEHPLPFGYSFTAVWGASASDIWATGDFGTLLHFDGTSWRARASGTDEGIKSVWGTATNNVWIVGRNGYLRRWNGSSLVTSPGAPTNLYAEDVSGSAANNVWVVGSFGTSDLFRFNGSSWMGYTNPEFFGPDGVWAASPTQAWAFGFSDTSLAFNGSAWTKVTGIPDTNSDVWGSSATDVWVAGRQGVHRWNGTAWTRSLDASYVRGIDGTSASNVVAGGEGGLHRYDGATWKTWTTDAFVDGVWASSPTLAWAAGLSGRLWSWNGTTWTKRTGFGVAYSLESIWVGQNELWFVGSGALRRSATGVLEDFGPLFGVEWYDIVDVWGASANDIWAVGPDGRFAHWNGAHWSITKPLPDLPDLKAIWGSGPNDIYAVTEAVDPFEPSNAYVVRWNGSTWSVVKTIQEGVGGTWGIDLRSVGGAGPSDVWVGADNGALWHFDGATWTRSEVAGASDIYDIWASPAGTVWLATFSGVFRRVGTSFMKIAGLDTQVGTITGSSDADVWVTIGDPLNPTASVAHWNGSTWTRQNTGAGQEVRRLAVTADAIYAAGRAGAILRKAR